MFLSDNNKVVTVGMSQPADDGGNDNECCENVQDAVEVEDCPTEFLFFLWMDFHMPGEGHGEGAGDDGSGGDDGFDVILPYHNS